MIVGLKDFKKEYKNYKFIYKIKQLRWELKYAWQRAWRGYDNQEIFELDNKFLSRMLPILKDFKKSNIALFTERFDDGTFQIKTKEETNQIIDEMIALLENCDPDAWVDFVDDYKTEYLPFIQEYERQAYSNQHDFLDLFNKWFDNLWY